MTMTTVVVVVDPVNPHLLMAETVRLLGWEGRADFVAPALVDNVHSIETVQGQGLPAWVRVRYGKDGPLGLQGSEVDQIPPWSDRHCARVVLDTGYGYRAANGAGCGDLHAFLVSELGAWLEDRGVKWGWIEEGESGLIVHSSGDSTASLGEALIGRP